MLWLSPRPMQFLRFPQILKKMRIHEAYWLLAYKLTLRLKVVHFQRALLSNLSRVYQN